MDDGALAQFTSITSTNPENAQRYLAFTDGDLQQAIELFFANNGADLDIPSASSPPASSRAPPVPPPATRPPQEQHAVQIDSDSDPDYDDYPTTRRPGSTAKQPARVDRGMPSSHTPSRSTPPTYNAGGGVNDDEAFARQLQQEMYGEAGIDTAVDPEGVRAPIARTTETLVGPDSFDSNDPGDPNAAVLEQLRARQRATPRGTFSLAVS